MTVIIDMRTRHKRGSAQDDVPRHDLLKRWQAAVWEANHSPIDDDPDYNEKMAALVAAQDAVEVQISAMPVRTLADAAAKGECLAVTFGYHIEEGGCLFEPEFYSALLQFMRDVVAVIRRDPRNLAVQS